MNSRRAGQDTLVSRLRSPSQENTLIDTSGFPKNGMCKGMCVLHVDDELHFLNAVATTQRIVLNSFGIEFISHQVQRNSRPLSDLLAILSQRERDIGLILLDHDLGLPSLGGEYKDTGATLVPNLSAARDSMPSKKYFEVTMLSGIEAFLRETELFRGRGIATLSKSIKPQQLLAYILGRLEGVQQTRRIKGTYANLLEPKQRISQLTYLANVVKAYLIGHCRAPVELTEGRGFRIFSLKEERVSTSTANYQGSLSSRYAPQNRDPIFYRMCASLAIIVTYFETRLQSTAQYSLHFAPGQPAQPQKGFESEKQDLVTRIEVQGANYRSTEQAYIQLLHCPEFTAFEQSVSALNAELGKARMPPKNVGLKHEGDRIIISSNYALAFPPI